MSRPPQTRSSALLYLAPVLWGATFPAAKLAIQPLGPLPLMTFMAWSRVLGFATILVALPLVVRRQHFKVREALRPGVILGGLIFVAYIFQTWGLEHTTATNAGFITSLYVVITPVLAALLFGEPAGRAAWVAVGVSVVGMALLSVQDIAALDFRGGDLLVLASAFAWAGQVVALGRFAPHHDATTLALVQIGAAALFHSIAAVPTGVHFGDAVNVWHLLIVTGVLGTGVAYTFQVMAQRDIDPTRAVIILAGESLAAALFAAVWIDERLLVHQWAGAILVLTAMTVSELGARRATTEVLTETV